RRSSGGRRGGPPRLEALRAVHRTIRARREGDLRLLPAVRAHDVVHVRGARRAAFGLGLLTAIGTALRLVDETLLLIELLLARAPHEGVAALAAGEALVRERHLRLLPRRILGRRSSEPGGLLQTLAQRGLRPPEPGARRFGRIEAAAIELDAARTLGRVADLGRGAEHLPELGDELVHARGYAGADVEGAGPVP